MSGNKGSGRRVPSRDFPSQRWEGGRTVEAVNNKRNELSTGEMVGPLIEGGGKTRIRFGEGGDLMVAFTSLVYCDLYKTDECCKEHTGTNPSGSAYCPQCENGWGQGGHGVKKERGIELWPKGRGNGSP